MMDRDFFTNASPHTNFMETNDPYSDLASLSNDAFALRELIGKLSSGATSSPYDTTTIQRGSMGNSVPLPSLVADPGFAERAAKFSCFGSRSFNGRTAPMGEFVQQSRSGSPLKLPRVSSSPALKLQQQGGGSNVGVEKKFSKLAGSGVNSGDEMESSVSEQISNEMSSRKRKGVSRGKSKQDEDGNAKRVKVVGGESERNESGGAKMEEDGNADEKKAEPPKDYIHVRARRGQATDSHSLAERVRREKISERMKLLQDLVPGCNKVTGKALMLDEIINYVQSLQRQVEFLSMKLASVNPELDFNMDNAISTKDMLQQNGNVSQEMYPLDSSPPMYNHNHHHQSHQNVQPPQHLQISTLLDHAVPLDAPLCRNLGGLQLPSLDGFSEFAAFGEDDLQSIVQMGFVQSPANFPVPYQTSNMKVEL